jgi:hypothetical protein
MDGYIFSDFVDLKGNFHEKNKFIQIYGFHKMYKKWQVSEKNGKTEKCSQVKNAGK